MTKRAKKPVKSPLTREEVIAQMNNNAEFKKRMKFIKTEFYPLLCETADSIEDASTFLGGFNTALMQAFLGLMKEKQFSDLKLDEAISGEFGKYKALLQLFNGMTIFEAKDYIEGMKNEIALFKQDEDRNRPLKDLKAVWLDEIK